MGRSLDGAFSHPLYVDNKKVSCKEIQILTGSDKRLIAQELEGTGLKDQGQEDLIRVGQEGLNDSTTTTTFLKRGQFVDVIINYSNYCHIMCQENGKKQEKIIILRKQIEDSNIMSCFRATLV